MPRSARHRSPVTVLHDRLGLVLAAFVALTVVPLASNRASLWLMWTALFSAIAIVALLRSWQVEPDWRPRLKSQRLPFLLALVVPVWAVLQILPIGAILPLPADGPTQISVLPVAAASGILRLIGYLILAALILEIASRRERVLRVGYILFAGIVLQAVFSVVALEMLGDLSLWGPKTAYLGSATGTFVNRNSLATYLGLGILLGLGLLVERSMRDSIRSTRKAKSFLRLGVGGVLILSGTAFMLIALIATQSRLGIVASLAGLIVTAILIRHRSGTPAIRLMAEGGVALLALGFFVALLGAGGLTDRLLFTSADGVTRLALYSQTLTMIMERPLTGYGMDAFGTAFEAFRAPPLNEPVSYDLAHNSYLTLWAEFGLIAGSAPIFALGLVALRLTQRLDFDNGFPGMAAAALGALVLVALHSLGDFSLEIPANAYLLITLLALGLGVRSGSATTPSQNELRTADGVVLQSTSGDLERPL
jgi:O-antigen ligase